MYSFRFTTISDDIGDILQLAKWDGHQRPAAIYTITQNGQGYCNCPGSIRGPICKHIELVQKVFKLCETEQLGLPQVALIGAFYDDEKELLYTPADNEGIPISGAFNLAYHH